MSKEQLCFLQITAKHQDFFCYHISSDKNFIPKYPDNALTDSVLTSRTSRQLLGEKAPVNDFVGLSSQCREILLQVKQAMASFVSMRTPMSLKPCS